MSTYSDILQQTISEYDNEIDNRKGSPLYFLIILPASVIYKYVQDLITSIYNSMFITTATDKNAFLLNFGVTPLEGKKGNGVLYITISSDLELYSFAKGTIFTSTLGNVQTTTENILTENNYINVETIENTIEVIPIGTIFKTNQYGSLISASVSTQISNGTPDESQNDALERAYQYIQQHPTGTLCITNCIKYKFPSVIGIHTSKMTNIEVRKHLLRPSGIKSDIYVKTNLELISTTLIYPYIVKDNIIKITESSEYIKDIISTNTYTHKEENQLTLLNPEYKNAITLSYLRNTLIDDIQNYVDSDDNFTMGVDFLVLRAYSTYISCIIHVNNEDDKKVIKKSIEDYIYNHELKPFIISDLIETINLKNYDLPITMKFETYENGKSKIEDTVTGVYDSSLHAYYPDTIIVL